MHSQEYQSQYYYCFNGKKFWKFINWKKFNRGFPSSMFLNDQMAQGSD